MDNTEGNQSIINVNTDRICMAQNTIHKKQAVGKDKASVEILVHVGNIQYCSKHHCENGITIRKRNLA